MIGGSFSKLAKVVVDPKTTLLKSEKGKRVWVNEGRRAILKCCWTKWNKIMAGQNHDFIRNSDFPGFPSSSYRCHLGFLHIYLEELMWGKPVVIQETPFEMIAKSISNLSEFYQKNSSIVSFDFRSELHKYHELLVNLPVVIYEEMLSLRNLIDLQLPEVARLKVGKIHGDLTFRNILVAGNQLHFIDFEQTECSLPEFDYLTLRLDWEVYQSQRVTYEKYFKFLIGYFEENALEGFYQQCPFYRDCNSEYSKEILLLFIYRFLVYRINCNLNNETDRVLLILNYLYRKISEYAK